MAEPAPLLAHHRSTLVRAVHRLHPQLQPRPRLVWAAPATLHDSSPHLVGGPRHTTGTTTSIVHPALRMGAEGAECRFVQVLGADRWLWCAWPPAGCAADRPCEPVLPLMSQGP